MNWSYILKLLIYTAIFAVILYLTGQTIIQSIGFGFIAGFVIGILNQIHSDLLDLIDVFTDEDPE